jgi:hypothetical protein
MQFINVNFPYRYYYKFPWLVKVSKWNYKFSYHKDVYIFYDSIYNLFLFIQVLL